MTLASARPANHICEHLSLLADSERRALLSAFLRPRRQSLGSTLADGSHGNACGFEARAQLGGELVRPGRVPVDA